jgi:hypothetical protein
MSVVYSGSNTSSTIACSGDYMYLSSDKNSNESYIQKIALPTYVIDTSNWASTKFVFGMAIYNNYIYTVGGGKNIYKIFLDDPTQQPLLATLGDSLCGIVMSDDCMYVSNHGETSQVIKLTTTAEVINTFTFTYNVKPSQMCILDNFLYTSNANNSISRIDLIGSTVTEEWFILSNYPSCKGIAAYGNYVYVSVTSNNMSKPNNIVQISLDGTTLKTFDTTYNLSHDCQDKLRIN